MHTKTHTHTQTHMCTKAAGTQEVEAHGSVPEIQDPVSKQTQRLQAPSVPLNYAGRSAPCACVEHRAWQSPGSPKAPLSQIPSKGCQPACLQLLSTIDWLSELTSLSLLALHFQPWALSTAALLQHCLLPPLSRATRHVLVSSLTSTSALAYPLREATL